MKAAFTASRLCTIAGAAVLVGCAHKAPAPLYLWESFPRQQYDALLAAGIAPADQIETMQAHAIKARAEGAALPPGFRAHLGMLKLAAGDLDQARQLWEDEKTAFPESAPFMNRLLQKLDAPAKKDNPA